MAKNKTIDIVSKGKVDNENKKLDGIYCAFCGKKYEDEKNSGLNFLRSSLNDEIAICDVCLDTLYDTNRIIRDGNLNNASFDGFENDNSSDDIDIGKMEDYTPKMIKEQLDQYVIGQEKAKRALSIAAYNHIKRVNNMDMELEKTNVLLVGPTGCGKTYLVQTLAQILSVPCVTIDITGYSETGYKGKDLVEILKSLYYEAGGNVALAERGIIFIDEIDKTAGNSSNSSHVSDTKVQQGLLKMMEGIEEEFAENEWSDPITINTKNILFIFSGAFVGIEKFQKGNEKSMGFLSATVSNNKSPELKDVTPKQLIKYGMIPEFIGRTPKIVTLKALKEDDLIDIMKNSKGSAIANYQKMLSLDGYELEFSDDALREIAKMSIKAETGARALRSIIEASIEDIMFDGPRLTKTGKIKKSKEKIVITKEKVEQYASQIIAES